MKQLIHRLTKRVFGGVIGALTLAGVYVFVIVAIYYGRGPALQKLIHLDQWTLTGVEKVFFDIAILGFILGGFFCNTVRKWFPSVIICVPIILFGFFLYNYAIRVPIPQSIKLADCTTNSTININLHVPKGKLYTLFASSPSYEHPFANGRVRILEDTALVGEFQFSGGGQGIQWFPGGFGCSLTDFWNTTNSPTSWNQIIKPQKDYDLQITFDRPPPPSASIWLHWLQAWKDNDK